MDKKQGLAQALQNIALVSLLIVGGKIFGYVNISWFHIGVVLVSTLLFEYIFSKRISASSLNSALGICLFLRTTNLLIYVFAACFAMASKYLFRWKGKHFLNPSYTAIFLCLILFSQIAYTNPLQWQGHLLPLTFIILLGSIVQSQVRFFDGIMAFILSFVIFFLTLTAGGIDEFQTLILTGSFFIVAFFGLTDPATTPKKRIDRILFMVQVSVLFFVWRFWINENYAIFAAYLTTQLFEPLYRYMQTKKLRTQTQWITLSISLVLVLGLTWFYVQEHHLLPDILSNRCNQLLC